MYTYSTHARSYEISAYRKNKINIKGKDVSTAGVRRLLQTVSSKLFSEGTVSVLSLV